MTKLLSASQFINTLYYRPLTYTFNRINFIYCYPFMAPKVLFPIARWLWVVFAVLRFLIGGFVLLGAIPYIIRLINP